MPKFPCEEKRKQDSDTEMDQLEKGENVLKEEGEVEEAKSGQKEVRQPQIVQFFLTIEGKRLVSNGHDY